MTFVARDVITQADIESKILDTNRRGEELVNSIEEAAMRDAKADVAFKVAYAKQMLVAPGKSEKMREAYATIHTESEYSERRIAAALLMSAREAATQNRSALDGYRTLSASLRFQV